MTRRYYRLATYLHGPLAYGVSDRGVSFVGRALVASSDWNGIRVRGESANVFWIAASGMPTLYFPIAELKQRGLYERVRELANTTGVELIRPGRRQASFRLHPNVAHLTFASGHTYHVEAVRDAGRWIASLEPAEGQLLLRA
ncbi:MAG: hypothetical protein ABI625_04105 [bacterium]